MSTNVDVVRQLYLSFAHSDVEGARALLDDDVQWLQCAGFPGGGHHRGADLVLQRVFGNLRSQWIEFSATVDEYLDAGDCVVTVGSYAGRHTVTGTAMTAVFAHIFDVENGRITRFRQYADTAPMLKAMMVEY